MTAVHAPLTSAAEVAAAVADEIRTRGHYQSKVGQTTASSVCLVINSAYLLADRRAWNQYCHKLRQIIANPNQAPITWNDSHSTDEVLAVLDTIAKEHSNA